MKPRYRIFANDMGDLPKAQQRLVEGYAAIKWLRRRIVLTLHPLAFIANHIARTQQRVYLEQIARGMHRVIVDDSRRPTMLGALLALLLAMISGYLVIYLAIFPDFVDMLQHSVLILVAALALLIGYTTIWVRFGAGALYRIRHESY